MLARTVTLFLLIVFVTVNSSVRGDFDLDLSLMYPSCLLMTEWAITNTSGSILSLCASVDDIVEHYRYYEADSCVASGVRVRDMISGCDTNGNGNVCIGEYLLCPFCNCFGTIEQNWCAMLMFANEQTGNMRAVPPR